jgi:hypothetical protein
MTPTSDSRGLPNAPDPCSTKFAPPAATTRSSCCRWTSPISNPYDETGRYYDNCRPRQPSALAQDSALAAELWNRSESWTS